MESARIKLLRFKLNLTQKQFAERLSVSLTTVKFWETDRSKPSDYSLFKLNKLRKENK